MKLRTADLLKVTKQIKRHGIMNLIVTLDNEVKLCFTQHETPAKFFSKVYWTLPLLSTDDEPLNISFDAQFFVELIDKNKNRDWLPLHFAGNTLYIDDDRLLAYESKADFSFISFDNKIDLQLKSAVKVVSPYRGKEKDHFIRHYALKINDNSIALSTCDRRRLAKVEIPAKTTASDHMHIIPHFAMEWLNLNEPLGFSHKDKFSVIEQGNLVLQIESFLPFDNYPILARKDPELFETTLTQANLSPVLDSLSNVKDAILVMEFKDNTLNVRGVQDDDRSIDIIAPFTIEIPKVSQDLTIGFTAKSLTDAFKSLQSEQIHIKFFDVPFCEFPPFALLRGDKLENVEIYLALVWIG